MLDGLFFFWGGASRKKHHPTRDEVFIWIFPSKNWRRLIAPKRHFKISFCGVFFRSTFGDCISVKYLDSADGDGFHPYRPWVLQVVH